MANFNMESLLLTLVFTQLASMIFLLIRTFPTLQAKVNAQEKEISDVKSTGDNREKRLNAQALELMGIKTEMIAFKKDYEESKKANNETNKELRKTLEDVTRAVISLEVTLKHFNERLEHFNERLEQKNTRNE